MKHCSSLVSGLVIAVILLGGVESFAQRTAANSSNVQPYSRIVPCVVAGPRATLVFEPIKVEPVEPTPDEPALSYDGEVVPQPIGRSIGDAFNFAREDQSVTLHWGQMLDVKLSDRIEGVWYNHAKGWLGAVIILDIRRPDIDPGNELTDEEDAWVTLGRDGAADFRVGPSIGRAKDIGVKFYPRRPGHYLLRARAYTYALPFLPTDDGVEPPPPTPDDIRKFGKVAADTVYVKVRVVYPNVEVPEVPEPPVQGEIMPHQDLEGVIR